MHACFRGAVCVYRSQPQQCMLLTSCMRDVQTHTIGMVQGLAAPAGAPAGADPPLSRTGWTIRADSSETDSPVADFLDGNDNTMWHTGWRANDAPLPHTVSVVFPSTARVSGFTYLPRQDTSPNGRIGDFDVRCLVLHFPVPVLHLAQCPLLVPGGIASWCLCRLTQAQQSS